MKWQKLLLIFASLAIIVAAFEDEFEIPDDIDDDEIDEDEEILRLLEEKRIVSFENLTIMLKNKITIFF